MKYLKMFESQQDAESYVRECFLDVSENPNFEVDDLIINDLHKLVKSDWEKVYKIHIEKGESISLPHPISSNLYIGMVKTDSEFLKMSLDKMHDLLDDIEVALKRIGDKFPGSHFNIYANRRDEIDIEIYI